jgi:hypothetical protein
MARIFDMRSRAGRKTMKTIAGFLVMIVASWLVVAVAHALTVDDLIKLKQAGVSDSTIELLIKRGGDARSAGMWKQDGWIVYSTESRFPDTPRYEAYQNDHPITAYPEIYNGRRQRPR